jgi:TrmH family RNA methyltransferase
MLITSLKNPKVKQAVRLRDKRHRQREGLMLVEGHDELLLALESGAQPQGFFFCSSLMGESDAENFLERIKQSDTELLEVTSAVFEKIAYRENPDGWLAVFPMMRRTLADLLVRDNPLLVVAESIEKPGNLGAILRSADAAGADALILCDPKTDVTNPNVVRASKGTLFTVPVVETQRDEALRWLREKGITVVAATPQAQTIYTDVDWCGAVAIAVGTEDAGLSEACLQQADLTVRIPMLGRVNSLNVATATTLLLYEAMRQRTMKVK